jgi:hypothetical protein
MEPERDELPPEGARYKYRDWNPGAIPPDSTQEESRASHDAEETPAAGILVPITARDFREHWPELARYARLPKDRVGEFQKWAELARDINNLTTDLAQLKKHGDSSADESPLPPATRLWALYSVPDQISETLPTGLQALLAELKSYVRSILTPEQWAGVEARDAIMFEYTQFSRLPFLRNRLPRLALFFQDRSALLNGILAQLDHKQRVVFTEGAADIQLNLVQVLKALELPDAASFFSVDLIDWFSLKSHSLVNEEYLTREQLTELKDFKPFNVALGRRPTPNPGPTVPIHLVEFQTNWDRLSSLARITKNDIALIEYRERKTKNGDVIEPFLNEDQKDQLTAAGYTYISLQQIERLYSIGRFISVSSAVWLEHREIGVVFDQFLTEDVVRKLRAYPHFSDIYDTKYNAPLIAQRQAEQQKRDQEDAERARQERRARRRKTYRKFFLFVLIGALALAAYEYYGRSVVVSSDRTTPQTTQPAPPPPSIVTQSTIPSPDAQNTGEERGKEALQYLVAFFEHRKYLSTDGALKVANDSFDNVMRIAELAQAGDDAATYQAEATRVGTLEYPLGESSEFDNRKEARKINRETLASYREDIRKAIDSQWNALTYASNDVEVAGNLAYYLAFGQDYAMAGRMATYALSIPSPKSPATGRSADWQTLGISLAALGDIDKGRNAFLAALAISNSLSGYCKSLLSHGKMFGENVQKAATAAFERIRERNQSDVDPACAYPPSF